MMFGRAFVDRGAAARAHAESPSCGRGDLASPFPGSPRSRRQTGVLGAALQRLWIAHQLLVECAALCPERSAAERIERRAEVWSRAISRLESRLWSAAPARSPVGPGEHFVPRLVRAIAGIRAALLGPRDAERVAAEIETSMRAIRTLAADALRAAPAAEGARDLPPIAS